MHINTTIAKQENTLVILFFFLTKISSLKNQDKREKRKLSKLDLIALNPPRKTI